MKPIAKITNGKITAYVTQSGWLCGDEKLESFLNENIPIESVDYRHETVGEREAIKAAQIFGWNYERYPDLIDELIQENPDIKNEEVRIRQMFL